MGENEDVERTAGMQRRHTNDEALKALERGAQEGDLGDTIVNGDEMKTASSASSEHAAIAGKGEGPQSQGGAVNTRSKGKIAIIMGSMCMAVFLAALDVTIVTTALPTISEHFHSASGYTWIGSAFLLANAASIPSWGKISDIFGRKPMLLLANIIFMVGSLVAALSYSIGMLIAARAVQGIGGGGLVILVNITIGDLFPLRDRGAYYGIVGGVWAIASSVGPIIGGAFTEEVTWRWCFYINLPLDGIAFFLLLFFLDLETPRTPIVEGLKAIDWVGTATVVGGVLMFLFGLQYGGVTDPWQSATVICLIVFGVFTFALFLFWEAKYATYPLIAFDLFRKRTNIVTLAVVFIHGFVFISGSYYLPLYFQASLGATPILSGVYLLPTALSLSVSSIATGVYIKKVGLYRPPIWVALVFLTAGYGLFINLDAKSGWAKIILYQVVAGLGTGPLFQSPLIALQAHINPRDIATATSTFGLVRQLGTSMSVVMGQVVFQNQMNMKSAQLRAALGPQLAQQLSGGEAGANVGVIDALPAGEKAVARRLFANSLQPMWIMYTCIAAVGLIISIGIQKKVLTKEHQETTTGLDAEKQYAAERAQERQDRHESKRLSKLNRQSAGNLSNGDVSRPQTAGSTRSGGEKRSSKLSFGRSSQNSPDPEASGGLGDGVPPVPKLPSKEQLQQASGPVSTA